ncbi:MAG: Ig-like domain-containing protein, partial [Cryobacterium sp.]
RVTPAQAGAVLTVVVTVTGRNHSPALARSSGVRVKSLAEVTVSTKHRRVAPGATMTLTVTVRGSDSVTGAVTVRVNAKRHTVRLGDDGVGTLRLVSKTPGWYRVTASYPGSDTVSAARSAPVSFRVTR